MNPMAEAILRSWQPDFGALALMLLTGVIYVRGWRRLHRQMPHRFGRWRLVSFFTGLAAAALARFSPLDAFAGLLLTAHMIQHLLLMMVAPPLLLLGAPYLPLLRGLPGRVLKDGLGPFLAWPALQRFGRWLTHPAVGGLAFAVSNAAWHVPIMYELALRSPVWHEVEHLCFFSTAVLFWWPLIQPWPSRPQWPRWAMIPYLLFADLQNTALAAFLIFYERVLYPTYATVPRLWGLSVLADQTAAGVIMWVPGSLAYLIPLIGLITEWLSSRRAGRPSRFFSPPLTPQGKGAPSIPGSARRGAAWDLLAVPLVGAMLRRPHFRRAAQTIMLILAVIVIADGLLGHQMGPMNLAGVLPWIHWRGLVVIALLAVGNIFCMACPFMLTRDLGRRFLPARWRWPKALRSKWFAVGLLALYLWAYEAFRLWDSPWWTAWIVIGYFVTAFMVDGLFQGASFCKYVCPIGQFNFVQSLVSPLEVRVRSLDLCRTCTTYDCIRGNASQRGCELQLFQPKKAGNLDCTFCLDCIQACPQDNVGILAAVPGSHLMHDRYRSSLGRLSRRPDITVLILLLVFGAFVNAAGMVEPTATWEQALQMRMGIPSRLPIFTAWFVLAALIVPILMAGLCGLISRALSGIQVRWKELTCSFALMLVPLGFSMWLAHLVFHLLTGARTVAPLVQRVAVDLGIDRLGQPNWMSASVSPLCDWLPSVQIVLLDLGVLLTLYAGWRIAQRYTPRGMGAIGLVAPWATLAISLYIIGVWIIFQPMPMRGMMMH